MFEGIQDKLDFSKFDSKQLSELHFALVKMQESEGWKYFSGILAQINQNRSIELAVQASELVDILRGEFKKGEFRATFEIAALPALLTKQVANELDKLAKADENPTSDTASPERERLPDERS